MPRSKALLQHNLHEFQHSILEPILNLRTGFVDKIDSALVEQRTALGIEAVWWAYLGSTLEFFPFAEATRLMREHWVFIVHNFADFMRRRNQHFDPRLLIDSLPGMPEVVPIFADPCCLHSAFQELLIKTSIANANAALRSFSAALNFTSSEEWDGLMAQGIESSSAPQAAAVRVSLSVVGFAQALDFMATVRRTAELALASREVEEPDAYAFVRSVARLVRWRFSVHLPSIRERFVQVADRIFDMTQKMVGSSSEPARAKSTYVHRVKGMLEEWTTWGSTADGLAP